MSDNPTKPKRIQRKRTKGWRMPPNTVYVGRPSVWGNRYTIGIPGTGLGVVATAQEAVDGFRSMWKQPHQHGYIREMLRGKDLACWCHLCELHKAGKPMGEVCSDCSPCHVDVLLEIANAKDSL